METRNRPEPTTEELLAAFAVSRDPKLRDLIIERHEPLIRSVAQKFVRAGVTIDDLVQCGWIALIGAFDRFDPIHGTRFSTYAVHCVVGEIKRYFRDRTWSVKVPRHLQEIASRLNATQDRLIGTLQREPTVSEMAAALAVSEEDLLAAMELGSAYAPVGLDARREGSDGGDALPLAETVGGGDGEMDRIVEHAPLHAALATLEERTQRIIRMRFFEGCSQQEVADALGLSQMHISRLERGALLKLRGVLSETPGRPQAVPAARR